MENVITGHKNGKFLTWTRYFDNDKQRTISYDLSTKEFVRQLKNKEYRTLSYASISTFFRGISFGTVVETFNDEIYRPLIKFANRERGRKKNMGSILQDLDKVQHYESYLLLGINVDHRAYWNRTFQHPVSQFSKPIIEFMKNSRICFNNSSWEDAYRRTYYVQSNRDDNNDNNKKLINDLCNFVNTQYKNDLEVYRLLYKLVCDWLRDFVRITNEHNCDYKALFRYCIKMWQTEALPIRESIRLYHDYLNMMKQMDNPRIQKYCDNLRLRHDLTARNFNAWEKEYDEQKFANAINLNYEWKYGEYQIISPRNSEDIKKEGTELHHCVGSYVDKVLDGTTQILFMRKEEELSLVTIEVRNNSILQTKGQNNRNISEKEKHWLKKYAKAKNLSFKDIKHDSKLPCPTPNKRKIKCPKTKEVCGTSNDDPAKVDSFAPSMA